MAPFLWMGSDCLMATEALRGDFLPLSSLEFLLLIWSTSKGWKAELTLEPSGGFEPKTLELGIQHFNHSWKADVQIEIKLNAIAFWRSLRNLENLRRCIRF